MGGKLYGYGKSDVLFKPTKATKNPFRPTAEDAMSYFVGAEAMSNDKFKGEDAGFAINGGKGWKDVTFRNHQIDLNGPTAQAMGDYVFTDATSGDKVRVEYTFGYKRNDDGNVRITCTTRRCRTRPKRGAAAGSLAPRAPLGRVRLEVCGRVLERSSPSRPASAARALGEPLHGQTTWAGLMGRRIEWRDPPL